METDLNQRAEALLGEIRGCTVCAAQLPLGPRPIVQFSAMSRIVIIGQAPGTRVHASGIPWDDPSGDRLREWTGLGAIDFYNPAMVALVPMGFCYPGTGVSGDLPPRAECAPLWHRLILEIVPPDAPTLLVGSFAQDCYLPAAKRQSLTERVRDWTRHGPKFFPLPHPSWRSTGWMKRNPWFEVDVLPALRAMIRQRSRT